MHLIWYFILLNNTVFMDIVSFNCQQDPEKIPSPTLDTFFTTLASLRSDHGVPISLIVIDATPGGLGDRLSRLRYPSLRGTAGVMARELFVPLPQIQLGMLLSLLLTSMLSSTSILSHHCFISRYRYICK